MSVNFIHIKNWQHMLALIATVKIEQDLQALNVIVATKKRSTNTQQIWKGKI